jgi:hypothetical protein
MAREQRSRKLPVASGDAPRDPHANLPAEVEDAGADLPPVEAIEPGPTEEEAEGPPSVELDLVEESPGNLDLAPASVAVAVVAPHASHAVTGSFATVHPKGTRPWGILCRVAGPGSVAGHGIRLDGRVAHFWEAGSRGYFSQASIDKLPSLLVPEPD